MMAGSDVRARVMFALLAASIASGCARNAILELELELPPAPPGAARFAVVQARSDLDFDELWDEEPLEGFALSATCTRALSLACDDRTLDAGCSEIVSVIGDGDDLSRPLRVRIRFCVDPSCSAPEDASAPEHRVLIARAFYLGRYTQARVCVDEVPAEIAPAPQTIERCEVRCREGSAALHCRLDGTHFCEEPR